MGGNLNYGDARCTQRRSEVPLQWGNRSILFRDPDGNLVNLFTPVTDGTIRRATEN
jgi:hypothetical protein